MEKVIGENLKSILYQRNKTPAQLAEYLGITRSAVSRWISRNKVPKKWQIGVCEFLETTDSNFEKTLSNMKNIDSRSIYEIIMPMTKDQKINVIQFILGTL